MAIEQEQSTLTLRITKYNFVIKSIQNKIIEVKRFTQSILDKNTQNNLVVHRRRRGRAKPSLHNNLTFGTFVWDFRRFT